MKFIKFLLTLFSIILIPIIIVNLILGTGESGFNKLMIIQLFGMIFGIPYIIPALIFASDKEVKKKIKWFWISTGIIFLLAIILAIISMIFSSGSDSLAFAGFLLVGGAYVITLVIINLILSGMLKLKENKQLIIILISFLILLSIDLLQLFGWFRPSIFG